MIWHGDSLYYVDLRFPKTVDLTDSFISDIKTVIHKYIKELSFNPEYPNYEPSVVIKTENCYKLDGFDVCFMVETDEALTIDPGDDETPTSPGYPPSVCFYDKKNFTKEIIDVITMALKSVYIEDCEIEVEIEYIPDNDILEHPETYLDGYEEEYLDQRYYYYDD